MRGCLERRECDTGGAVLTTFFGDLETFCEVDLKTAGTHRYAQAAEIMLFPWTVDNEPVRLIDYTAGGQGHEEMLEAINSADEIVFHNSWFDRNVLKAQMPEACPPTERWHDTMVRALEHGLPGSLDKLGTIFHLDEDLRKLKEGRRLVQLFCKPRPKTTTLRRATRHTHPDDWKLFCEYAIKDVEAMRALHKKMPKWNWERERALWMLDQKINARGFLIDMDLVRAAITACDDEKEVLKDQVQEHTLGLVDSATKRDQMLQYLVAAYGVELPDMKKDTLQRRIDDETLPQSLRDLLSLRLEATTTSTAKYKALLRATSADGRLRGALQFCGAARTGRWAGRIFQPQNLPRPTHKQWEIDCFIEAVKMGGLDLVADSVMKAASSMIRGVIIAPPGKKLVVADLANIEGRGAAWLAGEEWKLQAFREYDTVMGKDGVWYGIDRWRELVLAGNAPELELDAKGEPIRLGPDLYKLAYAKAFDTTPDTVTKDQRQIGKVMELMLQYQGGVGAFLTGAATYNIDLDEMAEKAWPLIPDEVKGEAKGFMAWLYGQSKKSNLEYWMKKGRVPEEALEMAERERFRIRFGLSEKTFMVCDALKRLWRAAHPEISSYWKELEDTIRDAIRNKGQTFRARQVLVVCQGAWLRIILPSGRSLCYPSPRISDDGAISYLGVNQYNRQWCRIPSYGGKFFENITQAFARDALTSSMPAIEDDGFEIVLTVHDEDITEAPDDEYHSADRMAALMSCPPPWAPDLPLAAAGFEARRYKKE